MPVLAPPPREAPPQVLREAPPRRPTQAVTPAPCERSIWSHPRVGDSEDRILLQNISWPLYEALLDAAGDGLPRMTYNDGLLELMMPSPLHETAGFYMGHYIVAYCEEWYIPYVPTAKTTWRREVKKAGLEADESYYIQNRDKVLRQTEFDLSVVPPPDLAVEIDISRPLVEKEEVYARLGVPELWRWREGRVRVMLLGDERYTEADRSPALPDFPMQRLIDDIHSWPDRPTDEALRDFRLWCRDHAAASTPADAS